MTDIATHLCASLVLLFLATAAHAASQQGDEEQAARGDDAAAVRFVRLPQRISAVELKRTLMDIPEMIEIVDIRPIENFADFSLNGSKNATIANVITNPAYLTGTNPLIIVDRDGSLAMAVAGILSQKTARPIQVLSGGLETYWNDAVTPPSSAPAPAVPGVKPAASSPDSVKPAKPPPAAPQSPKKTKTSAGC